MKEAEIAYIMADCPFSIERRRRKTYCCLLILAWESMFEKRWALISYHTRVALTQALCCKWGEPYLFGSICCSGMGNEFLPSEGWRWKGCKPWDSVGVRSFLWWLQFLCLLAFWQTVWLGVIKQQANQTKEGKSFICLSALAINIQKLAFVLMMVKRKGWMETWDKELNHEELAPICRRSKLGLTRPVCSLNLIAKKTSMISGCIWFYGQHDEE